jgi:type I restriction enzyme S subunit
MTDDIFIGAFLLYLRDLGTLSKIAITGSGADSFTKYQFDYIKVPNFSDELKREIAKFFYNPTSYRTIDHDIVISHRHWNEEAGIYDIDKSIKSLKRQLEDTLMKITNSEPVEINLIQ